MTYTQIFNPVGGSLMWSALVSLIPILFFFWALAVRRMKGYRAGLLTLAIAFAVAVFFYRMPVPITIMSAVQGASYAILPIAWIIVPSVFLYKLSVKTGYFDTIRASIVSITEDRRLQALLVAFSFGSFLEGAAGFGAPVAICAALLVGLGFRPLLAAGVCLVANTPPVAFGAIGIPVLAMEGPTGIPAGDISAMIGRQLPLLAVVIPYYFIVLMAGFKKANEVLPAILVSGISFAVAQFAAANYLGPELPDIAAALASLVSLTLFLKVWKPKTVFRFDNAEGIAADTGGKGAAGIANKGKGKNSNAAGETAAGGSTVDRIADSDTAPGITANSDIANDGIANSGTAANGTTASKATGDKDAKLTGRQVLKAWSPFLILTVLISIWGIPAVKLALVGKYEGTNVLLRAVNALGEALTFHPNVPWLHKQVITENGQAMTAYFKLEFLGAAGTAILLAAVITKFIYGVRWGEWFAALGETINELKFPILTVMSVIGFAYIANYSGMSTTLGKTLALTGFLFPFFSPILGWLGVFITGSDTSANLLFGNLQKVTADSVGMPPVLALAANTSGGGTAKMISPQSIAIAAAAVGLNGRESELFRFTFKHSVLLVVVIGILTYLQATVLSWMVP